MGRRFANRPESDCDCRPSKRPDRFSLDVRASMGMLNRDMMLGGFEDEGEGWAGCEGISGSRRFWVASWCGLEDIVRYFVGRRMQWIYSVGPGVEQSVEQSVAVRIASVDGRRRES